MKIQGFKSFADKTEIHFDKDIIGIVGSNGCGKSNIVDAVRWVLGEQKSSSLRSDKMDNLIFNGSKSRSPSNRAEVSLTFDNDKNLLPTEFDTVTVTRLLYRTGESEYRINNVACRLKDFRTLFMDSGISSDSYAIIELGIVQEILLNKDNLRAKLLEQAAGISKFKKRKRETYNKLKGTEADLERIEDLLVEIEANLKSLESQARKAKRHAVAKDQYKENSIKLALHRLKDYKAGVKTIEVQKSSENNKHQDLQKMIAEAEAALAKTREDSTAFSAKLSEANKEVNGYDEELRKNKNQLSLLQERRKHLYDRQAELTQRIESEKAAVQQFVESNETLNTQLEVALGQEADFKNELAIKKESSLKSKELLVENKQQFEGIQKEFRQLEINALQIEKDIAVKDSQSKSKLREIENRQNQLVQKNEVLVKLRKELSDIETESVQLTNTLEESEAVLAEKKKNIAEKTEQIEAFRQTRQKQLRKLDNIRAEQKVLQGILERSEGTAPSVQFLKKHSNWTHRPESLADLFNCPEKYKLVIERYLNEFLDYFVVETMEEALSAITLLTSDEKGVAGFIVIEELNRKAPVIVDLPDLMSVNSLVEWKSGYELLGNHLLSSAYITTNEDKFSLISLDKEPTTITIANNEQIIKKGANIIGGSVGIFAGKRIGSLQKLENLQKEQLLQKKAIGETETSVFNLKNEIAELQKELPKQKIHNTRELLNRINRKFIQLESRIANEEQNMAEKDKQSAGFSQDIERLKGQINGLNETKISTAQQLEGKKDLLEKTQQTFEEAEEEHQKNSQTYNQLNIQFHKFTSELNKLRQQVAFNDQQRNRSISKQESDGVNLKKCSLEIKNLEESLVQLKEGITELQSVRQAAHVKYQEVKKQFDAFNQQIFTREKDLKRLTDSTVQIERQLQGYKDNFTQLEMRFLSTKERLSIEFGIKMEELMDRELEEEINVPELEASVEKLKKRLDNFGEVNPFAVEAYDEIKVRYDFMVTQRDDLVDARKNLEKTIKEIDQTASEKFLDAFEKVRDNFQHVFRNLFSPQDSCDLILSNPETPLESNIEIMAKPKGKKPASIKQLSGGEKSLTATALIFALYLLKPAPFCVLDEVDAPLDEANVIKFNKLIQSFAKNSQFIIVTHRPGTMAEVETLYGVTMVDNVSKVVPTDLTSYEELRQTA